MHGLDIGDAAFCHRLITGFFLLFLIDYGKLVRQTLASMLALATKVVRDYGKVLAEVIPGVHGLPESLLPHSKAQIRSAIAMLLENLEPEHTALKESLARGYVYLAQFVPDADAAVLARGGTRNAAQVDNSNESAMRLINRIKLDMERALEDLRAFGLGVDPK